MKLKLHREGEVAVREIEGSHSAKDNINPNTAHIARYRDITGNRATVSLKVPNSEKRAVEKADNMRKIFKDIISAGFILLMVLVLISGLSVLLGFEKPENIEGGDHHDLTGYAYGNWAATLLSIGIFSVFILSFLTPIKKQNWRTLGIYEAFIIALFSEMYGFPLTIYVLSSLFGMDLSFGHAQGHLLGVFLAKAGIMNMEAAWAFVMVASSAVIFFGLFLMSKGWSMIHASHGELVTGGVYRYVRHPQYLGLIVMTVGLLIQWPTIITLAMWPVLAVMYYRLAKREEKEALEAFGERYEYYRQHTPMFFPYMKQKKSTDQVIL